MSSLSEILCNTLDSIFDGVAACCCCRYAIERKKAPVRFVAARLSLLKEYCAPIVHTPGDVTSRQEPASMAFRQSSRKLISIMLLMVISLYGFPAIWPWTDTYCVTFDD